MNDPIPTPKMLGQLLRSQGGRCAYTGEKLTPDNVSADHHVSVKYGGGHGVSNIRLVTKQVNHAKGTMSYEEFVAMCRKVVEYFDHARDFTNAVGGEGEPEEEDNLFSCLCEVN